MSDNDPPPPQPVAPTVTLPHRSSVDSLFIGGPGISPGPMTLASSFFTDNDPDGECRSFSQLLAGATSSSAAAPNIGQDFRFRPNMPAGLMASPPPGMFTIPPGLSPASLLDSPGFFPSNSQLQMGIAHQHFLARVNPHAQILMHSEYPSLQQNVPPSNTKSDCNTKTNEPIKISQSDQKSQLSNLNVDKPADDGYNWRKYGQKQVKGAEYPRSYYKCTHPNCPVKKKVERSQDGQITEIVYKGQHNHPPTSKRGKDNSESEVQTGNGYKANEGVFKVQTGNGNKANEGVFGNKDQESSQVTPERVSGSSDSEEVGNDETGINGRDEDEPGSKRRIVEVQPLEQASTHRTVTEPKIIVQTTSEVDLLDDGYRWRKYGQKVVKGNAYPRSYYKCTSTGCNVRKHVERAASDPKAVITTYEGKHIHDVPAAKTSSNSSAIPTSQLRPHNTMTNTQMGNMRTDFRTNEQQPPVALLL